MDGVLIDDSKSYKLATKKTVEHFLGESIEFEEIEEYKGKGGYINDWDTAEALITEYGVTIPRDRVVEKFQQLYEGENFGGFIQNEKLLIDLNILKTIKNNYKLGIVTGRPRKQALYTLNRLAVVNYFDVIITKEDVHGKYKPGPCGIKKALENLNAKRAVYIGDNIDDMKAASAAGISFIAVVRSGNTNVIESFKKHGVADILKTVNDFENPFYC
jgi:HAD superfamily hydrolase (TIGR01548 family)